MVSEDVNERVEEKIYKPTGLISILEKIQSKYSYLPEKALKEVSKNTGLSLVDIYGVATFYKSFSLKPRGKHLISVCLGTACHVRGGPAIARELEKELGIKAGETTENREFTIETVNCLPSRSTSKKSPRRSVHRSTFTAKPPSRTIFRRFKQPTVRSIPRSAIPSRPAAISISFAF